MKSLPKTIKIKETISDDSDEKKFFEKRYKLKLKAKNNFNSSYCTGLYESKDRIIKLLIKGSDKAYESFLKIILNSSQQKNFPKIYSVECLKFVDGYRFYSNSDIVLVIVMEKLSHNSVKANKYTDFADQYINKINFTPEKSFTTALSVLCQKRLFQKHSSDFHNENIMFRKNGEAVIIDPAC